MDTLVAKAQLIASLDQRYKSRHALLPELFKTGQQGFYLPTLDDQAQMQITNSRRHNLFNKQSQGMAQTSRASYPFEQGAPNYESTQIDS